MIRTAENQLGLGCALQESRQSEAELVLSRLTSLVEMTTILNGDLAAKTHRIRREPPRSQCKEQPASETQTQLFGEYAEKVNAIAFLVLEMQEMVRNLEV